MEDLSLSRAATIWKWKRKGFQDLLAEPYGQPGDREVNIYTCVQSTIYVFVSYPLSQLVFPCSTSHTASHLSLADSPLLRGQIQVFTSPICRAIQVLGFYSYNHNIEEHTHVMIMSLQNAQYILLIVNFHWALPDENPCMYNCLFIQQTFI